jgi:hypothetical protein
MELTFSDNRSSTASNPSVRVTTAPSNPAVMPAIPVPEPIYFLILKKERKFKKVTRKKIYLNNFCAS